MTLLICDYGNHPLSSITHHLLVQSADRDRILTVTYRYTHTQVQVTGCNDSVTVVEFRSLGVMGVESRTCVGFDQLSNVNDSSLNDELGSDGRLCIPVHLLLHSLLHTHTHL